MTHFLKNGEIVLETNPQNFYEHDTQYALLSSNIGS